MAAPGFTVWRQSPSAKGIPLPSRLAGSGAHGRRSRGRDRGNKSPQNLERGGANANCPPRFCHIGTKMSVLWTSKYAKIRFRPGLCPRPRWGSSQRSPRTLSRLERGHPPHTYIPYPTRHGPIRHSPCGPPEVRSTPMPGRREPRPKTILMLSRSDRTPLIVMFVVI